MSRRSYSPTMEDLVCLLKLINEIFKRDMQIHTSEASIDQSNPALGENTGCESATHVLTGQLDAPIPDKPIPQDTKWKFPEDLIPAYLDLLDVRKMLLQSTQHASPCQGEDTWVECCKALQAAQDRFVQASKLIEHSPWCWKMLAHVIRTGPFPPDKKGDDKEGDDEEKDDEERDDEEEDGLSDDD
ncbi:hypothetical protein N7488_008695 [Penicillium malachiteum]|nr:hypothetical protein N7488_008695 [Penicillium malachiteum]